jgi:hypothetical protein
MIEIENNAPEYYKNFMNIYERDIKYNNVGLDFVDIRKFLAPTEESQKEYMSNYDPSATDVF